MTTALANHPGSPVYFTWGPTNAISIGANQFSYPMYKQVPYSTFQAIVTGTAGTLAATVDIQGTNDDLSGQGFATKANTATSTALVAATPDAFLNVTIGMLVYGPGIAADTYVSTKTDNNNLVLSNATTATATGVAIRFFANNWTKTSLGTITLSQAYSSPTTVSVSDGFASTSLTGLTWKYVRAKLSGIGGTGAVVQVLMGV